MLKVLLSVLKEQKKHMVEMEGLKTKSLVHVIHSDFLNRFI